MKATNWRNWGIAGRMMVIATLPVVLLFVAVVVYSYYSRSQEVQQELDERGHLVASLMAESSEYGVISGNLSYLARTANWLLQIDDSILRIEVLDAGRRQLIQATAVKSTEASPFVFDAPIGRELVALDTFGEMSGPHVSSSANAASTTAPRETVGYVRVALSPAGMLAKQRQRILVGSLIAASALLLSIVLGLALAVGLTKPLATTIAAVRSFRRGNHSFPMRPTAGGEIGELQTALAEMAENLDQFRGDLEGKVLARTRELQVARDEAVKSNAEKRRLIQKVNLAVEEERRNIAVEIHDHLNAELIVARLEAQRIVDVADREIASESLSEIKSRAQAIVQRTGSLYELTRGIVSRLRPEVIDTLGLRDAIEEMVRHYDALHPQCRFEFEAAGDFSGLRSDLAITAYRLVQEALSNVVKHADASVASIQLVLLEDKRVLQIRVTDNGKGFERDTVDTGIGLIGMGERVHSLGGKLEIVAVPLAGTAINIELPIGEDYK